jgi:hypothetical protein
MFQRAFDYITGLQPFDEPNYSHIRNYFRRNKTLILEPTLTLAHQQRTQVKRVSLNASHFLQVPPPQFGPRSPRKQGRTSAERLPSC